MASYSSIKPSSTFGTNAGNSYIQAGVDSNTITDLIPSIQKLATPDDLSYIGNKIGDQAFVEETNRLYLWNGSGWYSIALINTSPTWDSGGQPATSYALDADSPQDATVITLAASDPDGLPISYSYVTAGSMDSMATISQDSSVFTITPKTITEVGEGVELTGSITFRASDGINILPSISSFTLNFITIIENSKYTTLLVTATDTSDNNITDSSTNNHTVTASGDVRAGTFSPYRHGGYSAYMGGNGNYISTPHATSLKPSGTDDFCVSFWYYPNATPSTNTQVAGDFRVVSYPTSCNGWDLLHLTSNVLAVRWGYPNYADMNSGSTTLNIGEWNHIVYCKNDSTMSLFINGARANTTTSNIGMTASTLGSFYIGWAGGSSGSTEHSINGYITDFKLDIGGNNAFNATATSITVPTKRVTLGNNTKLFACHLPYLEDGSTSEHTLSFVGSSTGIKPFAPYDNLEYSVADHGGSVYFDGTGDYLTILHNTTLNMGNGSWTAEMWIYPDGNYTTYNTLFAKRLTPVGSTIEYEGYLTPTNGYLGYIGPSGSLQTSTATPITKTWNHVAYVYDGTNIEIFLNGVSVLDQATSSQDTTADLYIGCYNRDGVIYDYYYGYMCDFKLSKGQTTYTATFTPPIAPLSSSGTTLHIKGTDASIIDKSQGNNLKLVGTAAAVTSASSPTPPNNTNISLQNSVFLDGSGDCVSITPGYDDPVFNLGTVDWTIELWAYFKNLSSNRNLFSFLRAGLNEAVPHLYTSDTSLRYYVTQVDRITTASGVLTLNTWHHIVFTRNGNDHKIYVDGSQVGNTWSNGITYVQGRPVLGDWHSSLNNLTNATNTLHGYVQDFRITKGLARYTANFTPPTEPLKG